MRKNGKYHKSYSPQAQAYEIFCVLSETYIPERPRDEKYQNSIDIRGDDLATLSKHYNCCSFYYKSMPLYLIKEDKNDYHTPSPLSKLKKVGVNTANIFYF